MIFPILSVKWIFHFTDKFGRPEVKSESSETSKRGHTILDVLVSKLTIGVQSY